MKAVIAIGTNLNQRDNALSVREYLGGMFGSDIVFTQFMKTKPADGGDGYYINALAEINTNMSYEALKKWFKDLEQNCGRNQEDTGEGYVPPAFNLYFFSCFIGLFSAIRCIFP